MRLEQLLKPLDSYELKPAISDFEVKGVTCDSKQVTDGFIFVAIKGNRVDGHKFIDEAINKGAKAVVVQSQDASHPSIGSTSLTTSSLGAGKA